MLAQFHRTYKNRGSLKDLSLIAWISCFFASIFMGIRLIEIQEWAMVGMETVGGLTDLFTVWWVVKSIRKRTKATMHK